MKAYDITLTAGIRSMKKIPLPIKLSLINKILSKGAKRLEVTSVEHIPQFEDREDLIKNLPTGPDYYASIVNPHGFDLIGKYYPTIKGVSVKTSVIEAYQDMNDGKKMFTDVRYIINDTKIKSRVYLDETGFSNIDLPSKYYLPTLTKQLFSMGAHEVILDNPSFDVLDELKGYNIGAIYRRCGIKTIKLLAENGVKSIDVALFNGKDDQNIVGYESL